MLKPNVNDYVKEVDGNKEVDFQAFILDTQKYIEYLERKIIVANEVLKIGD